MAGRNVTNLNNYLVDHGGYARATFLEAKSGPASAPTWTITCKIDNLPRGIGSNASKGAAKDEACRKALEWLRANE